MLEEFASLPNMTKRVPLCLERSVRDETRIQLVWYFRSLKFNLDLNDSEYKQEQKL